MASGSYMMCTFPHEEELIQRAADVQTMKPQDASYCDLLYFVTGFPSSLDDSLLDTLKAQFWEYQVELDIMVKM